MSEIVWIPLSDLAHGRSGDKGDSFNIGLIAHKKKWLEILEISVTPKLLSEWYGDSVTGLISVWSMPGIGAINCLLRGGLGGGATTSLMLDAQGKIWGQSVLRMRVPVNRKQASELGVSLNNQSENQWDMSHII
ncbi:MAG: hypothetical protein NZ774_06515 [Candidatus Poseidoniales archaeon]|nr:hypothetical protein [Candidatus Poseidoniales archaeon]